MEMVPGQARAVSIPSGDDGLSLVRCSWPVADPVLPAVRGSPNKARTYSLRYAIEPDSPALLISGPPARAARVVRSPQPRQQECKYEIYRLPVDGVEFDRLLQFRKQPER